MPRLIEYVLIFTLMSSQGFSQVKLKDPRGDGHGAGCIVYPVSTSMPDGIFDITGFSLKSSHGTITIEARMAAAVPWVYAGVFQNRHNRTFLPVIDIYVARGGKNGYKTLLPGRGARPAMPWQRAVVITGLPETVAAHIRASTRKMYRDVCVPRDVRVRGRIIRAVMPKRCIGMHPGEYSYLIGVTALRPMMGLRHKLSDTPDTFKDPLVAPLAPKPGRCNSWSEEDCAFGTCTNPNLTPRFLDIVAPKNIQKQALTPTKGVCAIPFIANLDRVTSPPDTKNPRGISVKDIKNDVITLLLPKGFDKTGISRGQIAGLYDENSRLLTSVVVIKVMGNVVVAKPIRKIKPQKGLEVRF